MYKVPFLLIRPIAVFHRSPSLPSPLRITRFYILFGQTLNVIESQAPRPMAKSRYYNLGRTRLRLRQYDQSCKTYPTLFMDEFSSKAIERICLWKLTT